MRLSRLSYPLVLALAAACVVVVSLRAQPTLQPPAEPTKNQPAVTGRPPADRPAAEPKRRFGLEAPLARSAGAIRLATYNIENLFDDQDNPAISGDIDDKNMTKPEALCKAAAAAIRRLDADVLCMQEVESYEALIQFRDRYLAGMGYDHVVSIDAGDPRGIECSVLSRFPLSDPKVWRDLPLGTEPEQVGNRANPNAGKALVMKRSPLRVTVDVPAEHVARLRKAEHPGAPAAEAGPYRLTLFVVHHKSGRDFGFQREREAGVVVGLVQDLLKSDPEANVAVLGDFNAQLSEKPMAVYREAGMVSVFADRSARDAATTSHSSGRTIDHILLGANARAEFIPASRFVLGTIDRPEGADWRTTPPPPGYASDHYPVAIDLWPHDKPVEPAAPARPAPADRPATRGAAPGK